MPAGRPITNNSRIAVQKREHMRRVRAAQKVQPLPINPHPLALALAKWKAS